LKIKAVSFTAFFVISEQTLCVIWFMQTIDDVLLKLESIIDWSKANDSAIGYFAVLYHHMTAAVQQGIQNGAFEDGPRMEKLDVLFAKDILMLLIFSCKIK
jgi:hypothetical protein